MQPYVYLHADTVLNFIKCIVFYFFQLCYDNINNTMTQISLFVRNRFMKFVFIQNSFHSNFVTMLLKENIAELYYMWFKMG